MRQAVAILVDSYRELNARRLFWVAMALSLLIVLCFVAVGITEKGVQILWWEVPAFINTALIAPATFYKFIFVQFGINVWLTWGATILALVSTSSMIPDLVRLGSIELVLSRPIGRVRLFLLKYFSGLLFVGVQVLAFTTASFIVIGIRGGTWEWGLFLAIPIVVLFFSYLFGICVLFGILTRSGNAALLLTVVVWLLIGGLHIAESAVLAVRLSDEQRVAVRTRDVEARELQIRTAEAAAEPSQEEIGRLRQLLDREQKTLTENKDSLAQSRRWHDGLFAAKTIFPKTAETSDLLTRHLMQEDEISAMISANQSTIRARGGARESQRLDRLTSETRAQAEQRSRSIWWVLGTSLAFEAVVLSVAAWLFVRRDF